MRLVCPMIVTHAQLVLRVLDRMPAFHRRDDLRQRDGWTTLASAEDLVGVYLQGEHPEDGSIAFYEDRFTATTKNGEVATVRYDQLQQVRGPRTKDPANPSLYILNLALESGATIELFVAGNNGKFFDSMEMTRLFISLINLNLRLAGKFDASD